MKPRRDFMISDFGFRISEFGIEKPNSQSTISLIRYAEHKIFIPDIDMLHGNFNP